MGVDGAEVVTHPRPEPDLADRAAEEFRHGDRQVGGGVLSGRATAGVHLRAALAAAACSEKAASWRFQKIWQPRSAARGQPSRQCQQAPGPAAGSRPPANLGLTPRAEAADMDQAAASVRAAGLGTTA